MNATPVIAAACGAKSAGTKRHAAQHGLCYSTTQPMDMTPRIKKMTAGAKEPKDDE